MRTNYFFSAVRQLTCHGKTVDIKKERLSATVFGHFSAGLLQLHDLLKQLRSNGYY